MVRTVQTLLRSQLARNEMQVSARTCGRQGNSTNYYLILGLRDKAAPPRSQQINKFPPKRVKNLATPSSIFIFIFSSSTGELCSQPIRGNDRRIGRMFPEHVERSFLDPEYSFDEYFQLGSRRKVGPIKNQLASPNTSNYVREETFAQLRTGFTQVFVDSAFKQLTMACLRHLICSGLICWAT